jgi:hypothetical protein
MGGKSEANSHQILFCFVQALAELGVVQLAKLS